MTNNERLQIAGKIQDILAEAEKAGREHEAKRGCEKYPVMVGYMESSLQQFCRKIVEGRFPLPKEGGISKCVPCEQ